MLYALGEPVAFVALVASFLLALLLRAVAIRLTARSLGLAERGDSITPRLREDIDPFGGVAAAIGGMGWGKMLSVDEVPRYRGKARAIAVFAAGPVLCIVLSQLLLVGYALAFPDNVLSIIGPADVLLGIGLPIVHQVLLSLAVGLLCFGILALIPIPPLDGFGILYNAVTRPGRALQWMRLWFEDKNIGVLVLLILCLFPFSAPLLLRILNALGLVFVRVWG
ncbi:hypothetical protein [Actinoplanes sp. M2I2]|uniref:hypothetical protein n=1 Tax=Actinoplanes sp. M2I2 TaxID=1734444 RepID=UPI002021F13B|nr:hypothetical protein [Actinoplanes sp. M2I2]